MAKLVVLTEGFTGLSYELSAERVTIGRAEDNSFQISEPSVSSHHCELIVSGNEIRVRDLNSTNGTYINDEQITEAVLKPGQILRLGRIELRLENGAVLPGLKRQTEKITVRGVRLDELGQAGQAPGAIQAKGFAKKEDKAARYFRIGAVAVLIVIALVLAYVFITIGRS
ncbi:MAG: FHA domain-containing protein [Verrucomicrobiae bacterium]|nr:FHA domain-containing protein [Verrucomicrobiae bacterium]MDW7979079.1 FHA domain-containing protein [Verrucomicrobiales bacterium]